MTTRSRHPHKHYWTWLLLISLAALAVRLGVTEYAVGLSSLPEAADGLDQLDYDLFARQMIAGQGYTLEDGAPTARRSPGTSLILIPVYWLFGPSFLAGRIWLALLSAATGLVAAQLVRPSLGDRAAVLTAAGMAIDPGLFYYAIHLWSEVPYCLAITLATWLTLEGLRAQNERTPWSTWGWAGLCWGFAILLRPQTILLGPLAIVAVVLVTASRRRRLVNCILCQGICAALVVAPWVVRNAVVLGKPSLATVVGGFTFYGAHNARTFHDPEYRGLWVIDRDMARDPLLSQHNELAKEGLAWQRGWEAVRANWSLMPQLTLAKLYRLIAPFEPTPNRAVYWSFALAWIAMAPLSLLGLIQLRQRDPWLCGLILWQVAAVVISTLVFYGAARFRHVLDPLLIPAAAVGLEVILRRVREEILVATRWVTSGTTTSRMMHAPSVTTSDDIAV